MTPDHANGYPHRTNPAEGVHEYPWQTTIAFVTITTKDRAPWLANPSVHTALRTTWQSARAWLVGRYVVMPDHVHFFAAPGDIETEIEAWILYWKRGLTRALQADAGKWQPRAWHMRMRSGAHCQQQWDYMRDNPVRAGLVAKPDDWPFAGEVFELSWRGGRRKSSRQDGSTESRPTV